MAMTPSSLGMYQGSSPGTPYMRQGTTPNSTGLYITPPRVPNPGDGSNMPITHHAQAMPWKNREDRTIRPGDQLFMARTSSNNPNTRRRNMVNLALLNQILRDGRAHYHQLVEAPRDRPGYGTSAIRMQNIDNIPSNPQTAGRSSAGNVLAQKTSASYFVTPDEGFDRDQFDALLDFETKLGVRNDQGFVPSEREIWRFDLSDLNSKNLPDATFVASESDHMRHQLEKYGPNITTPEFKRSLETTLNEVSARDDAAMRVVAEYSRIKASHARYVTREGIERFWNYMGTVVSTLFGQTNQIADTAAASLINWAEHGNVKATNIWGNNLRAAEDHVGLLLTAARDPSDPDTPGSIKDGAPFEITPYTAKHRQHPSFSALAYYDLAGRKRYGKVWFVGRVRYDVKKTRPEGRRKLAAGNVATQTYSSAVSAGQTLDKIDILQRVA